MMYLNISRYNFWFISILLLVLWACDDESDKQVTALTLESYFAETFFLEQKNELIACALGTNEGSISNAQNPIAVIFLPTENSTNFRYFETDNDDINPNDFSKYQELSLDDSPLFGGFLRKFEREAIEHPKWGVVTFIKDGNLHYSNPIKLKFPDLLSEVNNDLLTFDQSTILSPLFQWEDGSIKENEIYFHAITGPDGQLLSGTYTFDRFFRFYDLSNVVLNIRDVNPAPALVPNENYRYTMLGVSIDNWVNLVIEKDFNTF